MPKWAVATLQRHASDPRDVKAQQQLDAGTTGDSFWDAAQQQLANTGVAAMMLSRGLLAVWAHDQQAAG